MTIKQKQVVDEIRVEWKRLWQERLDDKVRAEGIATDNYDQLFIDRGTIIHATRDCKALNFKDILEEHKIINAERYVPVDPQIGGWAKFVKTNITNQKSRHKDHADLPLEKKEKQQSKKSGRGWLHV